MNKLIRVLFLAIAICTVAFADDRVVVNEVPEIDGATAASAIALVGGALAVLRSRRK